MLHFIYKYSIRSTSSLSRRSGDMLFKRCLMLSLVIAAVFTTPVRAQPSVPKPPITTSPRAALAVDPPAIRLASALNDDLLANLPDVFASVQLIGSTLEVHVTKDHPLLGSRIAASVASVRAASPAQAVVPSTRVVADAKYSLAELERIQAEITRRIAEFDARGIDIRRWGVDSTTNRLLIGVRGLTEESKQTLEAEFGVDRVSVFESAGFQKTGRSTDVPPWYGGIHLYTSVDCTAGFNMVWSGRAYASTAGHCRSGSFYNGSPARLVGTSILVIYYNGAPTDFQLLSAPEGVGGSIFVTESFSRPVRTWSTVYHAYGTPVCSNGYYTGERCGIVYLTRQSARDNAGFIIQNLEYATNGYSQSVVGGDSGGPVYQVNSPDNSIHAVGMIVGYDVSQPALYVFTPIKAIYDYTGAIVLGG